ncbi:MAG: peptide chain release factor N(5)-glutamine methyltransferase [Actinomycetes bacterium]
MTVAVGDLVRRAAGRLAAAEVPSPEHDAWALMEHASGLTRTRLLLVDPDADVPGVDRFEQYVERRAAREPLQHITGRAYFRHLTLAVGPGVFVPRPETELVAEAAIDAARQLDAPVVVDLCAGSGAIALAVADEVPAARVHAVEADPAAHAWAARNCAGCRVELRQGDMADAFPELDGLVDVLVSNPPYIPLGARIRDPEVAAHDPALALWSGEDGLDAVRVVEQVAARLLRPGGLVVVEHADLQGESAPAVFAATGRWTDVQDHRDLAGRDRYVTATLSP